MSFSGQMHGLVALDEANQVIRPAILWCDQRTQKQCDWITEKAGGAQGLLEYTNNAMLTGYTGGKLLWLREEEPDNFAKMRRFICPKDYIRFQLTGELATDVSDASGTGFFNTRERRWSDSLIELAGLPRSIFPDVLESCERAGRVTREAAQATGLPEGLPVYAGGGDAVIQDHGRGPDRAGHSGRGDRHGRERFHGPKGLRGQPGRQIADVLQQRAGSVARLWLHADGGRRVPLVPRYAVRDGLRGGAASGRKRLRRHGRAG